MSRLHVDKSEMERQEGGDHYTKMGIQPRTYIVANGLNFDEGNIIKYVSRWRSKNGLEDLKKAAHYLAMLIEDVEQGRQR